MIFKDDDFCIANKKKDSIRVLKSKKKYRKIELISFIFLVIVISICIASKFLWNEKAFFINLDSINVEPCKEFLFGTDSMGRDIFLMIWSGGRISVYIGFLACIISSSIGILYGTISGCASEVVDKIMMRFVEIILSIPSILIIIFFQGIIKVNTPTTIAIVIGISSFMEVSKMVRTDVRKINESEYILSAKYFGGGFFYILRKHRLPNFIPTIMFMIITNLISAITTESTLSFLGIGLSPDVVSLGGMLALADGAFLTNSWHIVIFPGVFLVAILLAITSIGNYVRKIGNRKGNNL